MKLQRRFTVLGQLLVYSILAAIFLIPFIWIVLGSVRAENEIFKYLSPLSFRTFVPIHWTVESYITVMGWNATGRAAGYNFGRNMLNTFFVSTAVVVCSLLFNTMGAYFFARLRFPKKSWLLMFVLATFLIPFEATMIPLYMVIRDLHLENTYWALIVPWYASPFVIFSLIQFMRESIPYELDEASANGWGGFRPNTLDDYCAEYNSRARHQCFIGVSIYLEFVLLAFDSGQ